MNKNYSEVIVIGGGIIGTSLAYGLSRESSVILIDKENSQLTASRGNFGLVWVQGKGLGMPRYTDWCIEATDEWPKFSSDLEEETGIPLHYKKSGGLSICLGEDEFNKRQETLEIMAKQSPCGNYDCTMLNRNELQKIVNPFELGAEVCGASYCSHDGTVNPLNLFRALHHGFQKKGGQYRCGHQVESIEQKNSNFIVKTQKDYFYSKKLVIAGGLVTTKLAKWIKLDVPVAPQRGQVLVTEKTDLKFPTATGEVRQNSDGSFMLGASHEDVGYDLDTTPNIITGISKRVIKTFPFLKDLHLIRSWGSLRVLTPDQKPVYAESEECQGAFVVTSHSGVSLASLHSSRLVQWILKGKCPPAFEVFHPKRFNV